MVVFTIVSSNYYTFWQKIPTIWRPYFCPVCQPKECAVVLTIANSGSHTFDRQTSFFGAPPLSQASTERVSSRPNDSKLWLPRFLTGEPRNVTILAPSPFARESTERVCSRSNDSIFQLLYSLKRWWAYPRKFTFPFLNKKERWRVNFAAKNLSDNDAWKGSFLIN